MSNTTCLIALERLHLLDLLPALIEDIAVPPSVHDEFGVRLPWLSRHAVADQALVAALATQMDTGEAEAIALAIELGKVLTILDDRKARRVARQLGLPIIGTVGLLVHAKARGLLPLVRPVLERLRVVGFRMSDALAEEALRRAGESPDPSR